MWLAAKFTKVIFWVVCCFFSHGYGKFLKLFSSETVFFVYALLNKCSFRTTWEYRARLA